MMIDDQSVNEYSFLDKTNNNNYSPTIPYPARLLTITVTIGHHHLQNNPNGHIDELQLGKVCTLHIYHTTSNNQYCSSIVGLDSFTGVD